MIGTAEQNIDEAGLVECGRVLKPALRRVPATMLVPKPGENLFTVIQVAVVAMIRLCAFVRAAARFAFIRAHGSAARSARSLGCPRVRR